MIPAMLINTVDWEATIRAVHHRMPVVVRKQLYDKCYLGVLCLLCHEMELSDHVFMCFHDVEIWREVLATASANWMSFAGSCSLLFSAVLQSLDRCFLDIGLYSILCKRFVLRDWCAEAMEVLESKKEAVSVVVGFVEHFVELYHSKAWLVKSAYRVKMKVVGLISDNTLISGLSCCMNSLLSNKVVRMLGIVNSFAISFGHYRSCLFFSGLDGNPHVLLGV
ncbi:hypothetical protein G9A89_003761 [Geosiphon pyriformis]|nr:hypothetical protein G9A89_003761 [Geosiphon pyriformis]